METWRFGDLRLDVANRSLTRAGHPVPLAPQLFDLLVHLLRHHARLVTKEQLLAAVWHQAFVGDGALTQAIWRLRQILEGSSLELQTVPRVGYRLVGEVGTEPPGVAPAPESASGPPAKHRVRRRLLAGAAGLVLLGLLLLAPWRSPQGSMPEVPTVLVLPFRALQPEGTHAWLGTALSEMMTSELGAGGGVQVVSPDRLARDGGRGALAGEPPAREVGRSLGADFVIDGRYYLQGDGASAELRVDVRLLEVRTGRLVDSADHRAPLTQLVDLIEVHGQAIRAGLHLGARPNVDAALWSWVLPLAPEAREGFFNGLARRREGDALAARKLFEAALARSPQDPLVHHALALGCADLGDMTCAERESELAERTSAGLPREARLWIAATAATVRGQPGEAVPRLEALTVLAPDQLDYTLELALVLAQAGRGAEALALLDRLEARPTIDRGDPRWPLVRARVHEASGDPRAQLAAADSAVERARARGAEGLEFQAELLAAEASVLTDSQGAAGRLAKLRDHAGAVRSSQDLARMLNVTAAALLRQGRFDEARDCALESLVLRRRLGHRRAAVDTLGLLSSIAYFRGQLNEASARLEEASQEALPLADPTLRARNLMNQGGVRIVVGDLAMSESLLRESRAIYASLGHRLGTAQAALRLIQVLCDRGALAEADRMVDALMPEVAEIGGDLAVRTRYWRSRVDFAQGRLDTARAGFSRLLQDLEAAGQPPRVAAGTLLMMGAVELSAGRWELARQYLDRATRTYLEAGEESSGSETEALLARAELALGQLDAAAARLAARGPAAARSESFYERTEWALTAALLTAAQGRPDEARRQLDELEKGGLASGVRYHVYDVRLARARILRDPAARRAALLVVADQAAADGFGIAELEARRLAGGES